MGSATHFAKHVLLLALAGSVLPCLAEGVRISHLHNLANFRGTIPYNHVTLFADREADEIYVADRNEVRVFNGTGMEVHRFDADPQLGAIYDLAVDERGDLLVLSWDSTNPSDRFFYITRCNYRGQPTARIEIDYIPEQFAAFRPNAMAYQDGTIYLLSKSQLILVVVDASGAFQRGYDLVKVLNISEDELSDSKISGFNLDADGNFLLTLPSLFRALVVSPEGKVLGSMGRPGSGPGTFGVAGGIAADGNGHYLVAEKLRSVVMVFDSSFRFVKEFGRYGHGPDNLIVPHDLVIGNAGRLYVTQLLDRGVSVFSLTSDSKD